MANQIKVQANSKFNPGCLSIISNGGADAVRRISELFPSLADGSNDRKRFEAGAIEDGDFDVTNGRNSKQVMLTTYLTGESVYINIRRQWDIRTDERKVGVSISTYPVYGSGHEQVYFAEQVFTTTRKQYHRLNARYWAARALRAHLCSKTPVERV